MDKFVTRGAQAALRQGAGPKQRKLQSLKQVSADD